MDCYSHLPSLSPSYSQTKAGEVVHTVDHEEPSETPDFLLLIDIPAGVIGDEVKLSVPGRGDYLNIREVEVYGVFSSNDFTNIAFSKPTSQSSTYEGLVSSNGVDGSKSNDAALAHTKLAINWWKVDLESSHVIQKVLIYNRVDCCLERIQEFHIKILKAGVPIFTFYHRTPIAGHESVTTIFVDVPEGVVGDEVKLSVPGQKRCQ